VGLLSVLKIIIFSALETHKGPPYILYMTFATIMTSLRDLRIFFVF